MQVADVVNKINPHGAQISNEGITRADAGSPQTFLILGSDRRFDESKKNNKALKHDIPARSDTMMLLRLDPDQRATSVLSLPRDLKVHIPGHGTDKLNASYSYGGPTLTVKTIKEYTGLEINHVVNINFGGFRDVVNAIAASTSMSTAATTTPTSACPSASATPRSTSSPATRSSAAPTR